MLINNASIAINQSLANSIAFNDTYMPAALIILFAAFIVLSVGFLISILSFSCVTATQERKFKWFGNLSWCSSSLSLIMIFTAGLFLSFQGPELTDFCRILDNMSEQPKSDDYPEFVASKLAPQLYECVYGSQKNLLSSLGISNQLNTLAALNQHLQAYT